MRRVATVLGIAVAALGGALPAGALADRTDVADGPTPDIVIGGLGNVDLAPDGTGGVVYLKQDGGFDHVFVSRYVGGAFQAPERVDPGTPNNSSRPRIAAGNGGKLAVVFLSNTGLLRGAVAPAAGQPFELKPATLGAIDAASATAIDMNAAGVAYVVATATACPAVACVRAIRLEGTTWTAVGGDFPSAAGNLNFAPAKTAGDSMHEPQVVVDNAGNAVIDWAEEGAVINTIEVYARRLTGTTSGVVQQASLPSYKTFPASGMSDQVAIAGDGAGNAWVAFRQLFVYPVNQNKPRAVLRRFAGAALEPEQVPDGLPEPPPGEGTEFPRVATSNNGGRGLFTTGRQLSFDVFSSDLGGTTWPGAQKSNAEAADAPQTPTTAVGDNGGVVAWSREPAANVPRVVYVRAMAYVPTRTFAPQKAVSDDSFGSVLPNGLEPVSASADVAGNSLVAFEQGGGNAGDPRRLVVARIDAPVITNPPPPPPPKDTTRPVVSLLKASPGTIALGTAFPRLAAKRLAKVTTISFTLTEAARAKVSFTRLLSGRRRGSRCVAPTSKLRRARHCTIRLAVGTTLSFSAKQGANRLRFSGRLTRTKKLVPGTYEVGLVATDAAKNASARRTTRLVVKAR